MPYFSVIVPVYNRRDEVEDLMRSLAAQTVKDFEVMIVEDGSSQPCGDIVERYAQQTDAHYYYKDNVVYNFLFHYKYYLFLFPKLFYQQKKIYSLFSQLFYSVIKNY